MFKRNLLQAIRVNLRRCNSNNTTTAAPEASNLKGAKTVLTGERGINKVTLLGRVGRDSEIRGSEANPVTVFPLATSYTLRTKDGEYVQKTEWHRISIFKPVLKEIVAQNVKRGDRVYVTGSINYSQFIDKNNNTQRVTSIIADDVISISSSQNRSYNENDLNKNDDESAR